MNTRKPAQSATFPFLNPRYRRSFPRLVAKLGGTTSCGDIVKAAQYLVDRRELIHGPSIREYEGAFARQIGVRHGISFSSGRIALYALLRALGIKSGDEVLLQVPTHIVVANAIRYVGAVPIYVDCRLEDYNMDLRQAERKISSRTKVLLLQHTFGVPADLEAALSLTRRKNLILLEDCVHSLGATFEGKPVGSFGRAAFFSTEETKTISSTMGGLAVTDDPELAASLLAFQSGCPVPSHSVTLHYLWRLITFHMFSQPYLHPYARKIYNCLKEGAPKPWGLDTATDEERRGLKPSPYEQKLSNAQAVLALRQLRRLEANIAHRRRVASAYSIKLKEHGMIVPRPPVKANPAFVRFPIWVDSPQAFFRETAACFQLGEWFSSVLEESASPVYGGYQVGSCPNAEASAQHLINLPTHPRVSQRDVDKIIGTMLFLHSVHHRSRSRAVEDPDS